MIHDMRGGRLGMVRGRGRDGERSSTYRQVILGKSSRNALGPPSDRSDTPNCG